jgi:hypothetical protein
MAAISGILWHTRRSEKLAMWRMFRRAVLPGALALATVLALAVNAFALSGTTIKLAEAEHFGPPAVAVDSSGTAFIAWADERGPAYTVRYCTIPAGATGCSHVNVLTPAGGKEPVIDGVHVLVDGSTVVILADVYGVGEEYEPEQEWTSTDGGATFNAVNAGKSVAEGILNADTGPLNAVIVPGSNALGFAWHTAVGPPTFAEFPFGALSECSVKKGKTCPFATLQPPAAEHQLGNLGGVVASQLGSNPGVLGVYETLGKPGCSTGTFDTAYVYGSGNQEAGNSYNISPGEGGSAWKVGLAEGDCEAEYPAVGGGQSGFGVLEKDVVNGQEVYHRFDQSNHTFDTPLVAVAGEGGISSSVSQDGAGGIYATFIAGLDEARLAYSFNGGVTWSGPTTLSAAQLGHLASAVGPTGQGWATWQVGESVYAQQFDAADSVVAPAVDMVTTTQTAGTAIGASIAVGPGTTGETDRATITGVNASSATGTVAYSLYSKSNCEPSSKVFSGATTAVAAGVAAPSAPVTSVLAPGQYYWQALYSGNEGSVYGVKGNLPSASSCGSEILTVAAPVSGYKIKSIVTNSDGTVTITLVPIESGKATLVLTVPTASIASAGAAKSKRCKHGQIKLKGKCRPASTVVGKTFGKGTAGSALKLTVHLSSKLKAKLKKGGSVHLTATLSYLSAFGGKATTHTYNLTVKGHQRKHRK